MFKGNIEVTQKIIQEHPCVMGGTLQYYYKSSLLKCKNKVENRLNEMQMNV
jgi:hypothetical protein